MQPHAQTNTPDPAHGDPPATPAPEQPVEVAAPAPPPPPPKPRDPSLPPPKKFTIRPPIGDKPGFIWVENDDGEGGLGRVYLVKMRFGREVERIRMTKHFKKFSAKHVRDEVDAVVGDLLYNEREHGAITEQRVREVIEKQARRAMGPPRGAPRRGPGGGGGGFRGPGGPGGGGPPRTPRPDGHGPGPGGPPPGGPRKYRGNLSGPGPGPTPRPSAPPGAMPPAPRPPRPAPPAP